MSTVYEKDLMPALSREVGDTVSPYQYNSNSLFSAINDGLRDFCLECTKQQYTVLGSGDTAYFSPDPSTDDQRLIILYAAICILRGEQAKSARTGVIHSNPAGRTDLSRVPELIEAQITRLERRIKEAWQHRARVAVEEEMEDSGGSELKSKNSSDSTWVEGTPITTIETTV